MISGGSTTARSRRRLLFVGAFPPPGSNVFGGNVSDCRALLATSFPDKLELTLLDSTQVSVPAPPLFRRALLAARRVVRFLRLFEAQRPDVLLLFASSGFSFVEKSLYIAYARARGVPSLLSIRSGHFIDQCYRSMVFRTLAKLLLYSPRCLLCQGERWRQFFGDILSIPLDRCVILESWVATNELLGLARQRLYVREGPQTILFMGSLERFKGVLELLEAVGTLRTSSATPAFQVSLLGTGSEMDRIRIWIHENGLEDTVRLEGYLDGSRKIDALHNADVFVLPSHTEGLPNAMIEAMAAGLPVVVTPVGSVPDVIVDGVNGVLVTPRDPVQLSRALLSLLTSRALRERLGQAAHTTAALRFGSERAADELVAAVERLSTPSAVET